MSTRAPKLINIASAAMIRWHDHEVSQVFFSNITGKILYKFNPYSRILSCNVTKSLKETH